MSGKGIILFGHGARNPEYVQPFQRIRAALLALEPQAEVEIGFLELTQPSFEAAVDALTARGIRQITVVPIFFAPGRHVLKDLPPLAASAMDRHPDLAIEIAPAVGESPLVVDAMARFALASANA
ncbi:MAG: CbiX/SirB N-terminal domain-containing protein [Rhodocyclaceae bacterium]|jgi:sirohydrochlorin cobaltochelatase|nr:CbiX/SirB N-terminal domain-containing protein [Rhodocyclaceae bacterium]